MAKRISYIDSLNASEQVSLLTQLLQDSVIKRKAEEIAKEMLAIVDEAIVALEVYRALDLLDVQTDVWDVSGGNRDGYVDPNDRAWEVFDEALEPFESEMQRWQKLNLPEQATAYCRGLLKGIQQFMTGSNEILDWIADAPEEAMSSIVEKFASWAPEESVREVQECYNSLLQDKTRHS